MSRVLAFLGLGLLIVLGGFLWLAAMSLYLVGWVLAM